MRSVASGLTSRLKQQRYLHFRFPLSEPRLERARVVAERFYDSLLLRADQVDARCQHTDADHGDDRDREPALAAGALGKAEIRAAGASATAAARPFGSAALEDILDIRRTATVIAARGQPGIARPLRLVAILCTRWLVAIATLAGLLLLLLAIGALTRRCPSIMETLGRYNKATKPETKIKILVGFCERRAHRAVHVAAGAEPAATARLT